jgi:molybdopterin-biosynthesis enzyme MoeA-like protein
VPMVRVDNVYILPGIPRLFQAMLAANTDRFQGPSFVLTTLFTQQGEGDIGEALRAIAEAHPTVQIGSYPKTTDEQHYTTKLCFEGRDQADVAAAVVAAREAFELYDA